MKRILSILIIVVALVLIIAAFLPKTMHITAETTINAPQSQVWDYVKLLANQENYSVRVMADPNIQLSYSGTDGTVGFTQTWKSEMSNVGAGEQEIIALEEGSSYQVEIRFAEPLSGSNYATTTLQTVNSNQTRVTTTFEGLCPWPMNIFSFIIVPQLRQDMQQTLNNLKAEIEG